MFASILQLPRELKSRMPFRYLQRSFSSRRDLGWPPAFRTHICSHISLQSQLGHEATMLLKEAISSNSNLEKCDHIMVMYNKTTLRSMGNAGC